jgi:hypothetical protein
MVSEHFVQESRRRVLQRLEETLGPDDLERLTAEGSDLSHQQAVRRARKLLQDEQ